MKPETRQINHPVCSSNHDDYGDDRYARSHDLLSIREELTSSQHADHQVSKNNIQVSTKQKH